MVTIDDVKKRIVSEHFFTAYDGRSGALAAGTYEGREKPRSNDADLEPLKMVVICVLVMDNQYTLVGQAFCANPENFDYEIGKQVAYDDAFDQAFSRVVFAAKPVV